MKSKSRNIIRIRKARAIQNISSSINESRGTLLEMERTIKSWVHERRTNQAIEARLAFNRLFGKKILP